jgi:hypothetical protein
MREMQACLATARARRSLRAFFVVGVSKMRRKSSELRVCDVRNVLERVNRHDGKFMKKIPVRILAARGASEVPIQNTR